MKFGRNNNWAESDLRGYLNGSYLTELERKFCSKNIIPHKVDLTSMDGFDDYGYTNDKVAAMTFDEYRKYTKGIGLVNNWQWLSTPNQTTSRGDTSYVQIVNDDGNMDYNDCNWNSNSVRPFCSGRRNKVSKILKLESRYQKNKQPFLYRSIQDKYKGMRYYDRR